MAGPVWQATAPPVGVANGTQDVSVAVSGLGTISAGDVLVAISEAVSASGVTSWSQIAGPTFSKAAGQGKENTAAAAAYAVWTHVCDGTETGTITFRRSTTVNNAVLAVSRFSGADPTTPFVDSDIAVGAGTTCVLVTLTATNTNSLSLQFLSFQSVAAGVTWTAPGAVTKQFSGQCTGQGVAVVLGTEPIAASGATGTRSWSHTTSTATRGLHVLLNPVLSTAASGVGAFTFSGTAATSAPDTASGSITFGGTAAATTVAAATGVIAFSGAAAATVTVAATGIVLFNGSGVISVASSSAGAFNINGTATSTTPTSAVGGIVFSSSGGSSTSVTASGAFNIGGTGAVAAMQPSASGSLVLSGSSVTSAPASALGAVTIVGTTVARAPDAAAGSITFSGTGDVVPQTATSATGSFEVAGTATTGPSPDTATGTMSFAGSAGLDSTPATATGAISFVGSVSGLPVPIAVVGSFIVAGSAVVAGASAASGVISLAGAVVVATAPMVGGGVITFLATASSTTPTPGAVGAVQIAGVGATRIPTPTAVERMFGVTSERRVAVIAGEMRSNGVRRERRIYPVEAM